MHYSRDALLPVAPDALTSSTADARLRASGAIDELSGNVRVTVRTLRAATRNRTPSNRALCQTFPDQNFVSGEDNMAIDQQPQEQKSAVPSQGADQKQADQTQTDEADGLKGKKPEELTPEELRLMADTMPGEGPGD
jgi:hypothetical protein